MEHEKTIKKISPPMLGDMLPQLKVQTTQGMKIIPDDYKGSWLILFSHPGDFTPVCTTEFVSFSERADEFKQLNTELLALSVDQNTSHLKWIEWINENTQTTIPFPIIADGLGTNAKKLGMIHPNKGNNTVRKLFIVDPKGVVRLTMTYPPETGRSVDEVLRALYALQMSDKYNMVAPENYPNNNWLEDYMLYPPPMSQQQVRERLAGYEAGKYNCKDWWLCGKNPTIPYNSPDNSNNN